MEMHRSKLSAAAVLPIFTKATCGKTLSLSMSEKKLSYMWKTWVVLGWTKIKNWKPINAPWNHFCGVVPLASLKTRNSHELEERKKVAVAIISTAVSFPFSRWRQKAPRCIPIFLVTLQPGFFWNYSPISYVYKNYLGSSCFLFCSL